MNSQTSRKKQAKARWPYKKAVESAENISGMYVTKPKHINSFPAFFLRQFRQSRFACPRIARVTSSEELGTTSKNNFRGITLVRGPILVVHSLTLIISCLSKISLCFEISSQMIKIRLLANHRVKPNRQKVYALLRLSMPSNHLRLLKFFHGTEIIKLTGTDPRIKLFVYLSPLLYQFYLCTGAFIILQCHSYLLWL